MADGTAFRASIDESGVAEVVLDVPGKSVNTLGTAVMAELDALLAGLAAESGIRACLIRSGKPKGFIAGAEIGEIAAITDEEEGRRKVVRGQRVFARLAELPFPTLAVIHGTCLGGGLELALACSARIAATDAQLGLPEVNLGIIPAWGGTQRLARLVGPRRAIELITAGRRVDGKRALALGLVDRVSPPTELGERARAFALELAEGQGADAQRRDRAGRLSRTRDGSPRSRGDGPRRRRGAVERLGGVALEKNPLGRRLLFRQARKKILEKTGGHYPAPLRALQAIEEGLDGSLEAGLAVEARLVSDLLVSPLSKNLVHVYDLFESVKRSPYAARRGEPPFLRAAVLGAGVMGGGISQLLAGAGLAVRLKDVAPERVAEGLRAARAVFDGQVKRRKLDATGLRRGMGRIAGTTDYSGFGRVDVVIEAVVEDLDVKRKVFAELDALTSPSAILASNTSSLPIREIASTVRDRSRVAGFHFFNPVDRMPLVEVVRAPDTSDATLAALYGLALALGKKPVVVTDSPGFLVNRILMPYLNEAVHLFEEGLDAATIDAAMTRFGMPVGPLALLDDVGLDVAVKAGKILHAAFPEHMEPAPLFVPLAATGRTGRKGGRGFYLYERGSRKDADDTLRSELGLARRERAGTTLAEVEIERRLVYLMVNEAARALEEGVVASASELDLAMIAGTGFPPFRGGLLRYADDIGLPAVVTSLERLADAVSPRFAPAPALRERAGRGGFYAFETSGSPSPVAASSDSHEASRDASRGRAPLREGQLSLDTQTPLAESPRG